ncbi:MAG: superoxide dismutase [Clostridiales bacterium]|nr:superoxide dismutase [Clostridiales bacterium]
MTEHYPFHNDPLPYAYDALEPYIDSETMHLHHDAHLQTYVDNLNSVLEKYPSLQNLSLEQLLLLPTLRTTTNRHLPTRNQPLRSSQHPIMTHNDRKKLIDNAGGVYNHRLFFESMAPGVKTQPRGQLAVAINESFGSFEHFKQLFTDAAMSIFGSGYAWLGVDHRRNLGRVGTLVITTTANQDVPIGICPILNLDVWEHAYYLGHANLRANYIANWWNVVNWAAVEARYQSCVNSNMV